jgi:phage baseplate assembly protein W
MSFDLEIINSDLKIKNDGSVKTISDTPKLRQDIIKIITTSLGSNKFHPWYGCAIGEATIGKNLPENVLDMEIKSSVEQSLDRLKTLQVAQTATQGVSLAEMIAEIGDIETGRNPIDPRQVNIVVSIMTKRLSKIEEIFTLTS